LHNCNGTEGALPKRDTTSKADIQTLIDSLGGILTNTEEQKECLLNSKDYPWASKNLATCLPLMAPGILNNGTATDEERTFSAQGLLPYLVNGTRYSMCSDGMPCRDFN